MGETEIPRRLEATQKLVWDVLSQRHNNMQANLQARYEQGLKEKDTIFLYLSNSKISPSPLNRSLPQIFFFMLVPEDLASKMANIKGINRQTQGNSPITLIRGGTCNSLTLEIRNQLPFFQSF